ncbi:MAG: M56 family metallopeptidase [Terracidiphilus sp.]|jgi:beta-lactamase regulating signal transducer with metallopeptidase domain
MIPVLIEAALRALVVALAVGTGLRLLRVRNVLAQKVAWGLVLAASLAMPLVMRWQWLPASAQIRLTWPAWIKTANSSNAESVVSSSANASSVNRAPAVTVKEPAHKASALQQFLASQEPMPTGGNRYPSPSISSGELSTPAHNRAAELLNKPARAGAALSQINPAMIAALAYLAICGLLLLRLLYGVGAAAKLWLAAAPVAQDDSAKMAPGLTLRSSEAVFSPVTIGSGVILPADYAEWDAEKLRIVLAHERSHIRQGDFYLQMLAGVYAAVFWFSPLGWWLRRKLSDLGEAISDRAGLEEAASRVSYAQVLLEFAAMPRPTLTGVAMARTTNLSHRIERLLNETIFRQSFAASRRALLVGLLFPLALIAATSMIRVEAAGQAPPTPPAPPVQAPAPAPPLPAAPLTGVSDPDQAPPAQAPASVPVPPAAPAAAPAPAPAPPTPGPYGEIHDQADGRSYSPSYSYSYEQSPSTSESNTKSYACGKTDANGKHVLGTCTSHGYSYSYSSNGDSWAIVTGPDQRINFTGEWNSGTREAIEKARKLSNGKFIWFTHNGKSYMIDDPALVAQIEVYSKPMEELGRQQAELGRQQAKLGEEQRQLGSQQRVASVPTPDMAKEIAQAAAAIAKLQDEKQAKISQDELAQIQNKLAELQGRLGEIQGILGDKEGELGEKQGHLGELQGKLGEQEGRLGEQEGKLAEEASRKMKSIIDQSLGNGKARPVE